LPPISWKSTHKNVKLYHYPKVLAAAVDLRVQGMTHIEVYKAMNRLGYRTRTGKRWRHPQQIVKLLRSFVESE
jgi:hypothetical protein